MLSVVLVIDTRMVIDQNTWRKESMYKKKADFAFVFIY